MKILDVVVIGAGPAGSTAARFCAQAGLKTAIIEKQKLPRDKTCAGGIIPAGLKFCNIQVPDYLIEKKCNSISLEYKRLKKIIQIQEPIIMVKRSDFDMYLVEEALKSGALLKENERLINFIHKNDHLFVSTTKNNYKAKILIGADGYLSTVRKILGISFNTRNSPIAIETTVPMDNSKIHEKFNSRIFITYIPGLMGYAWIFPKDNYISTGIGTFYKDASSIKEKFLIFLKNNKLSSYSPLRSWFIPPNYEQSNSLPEGIILAGDAAGFVDAFTGEGIRYAMISGKLAAASIINCFNRNEFSRDCLKEYDKLCNKFIISNLKYSKKISHYVYQYQRLIIPAAFKNQKILEKYANTLFGFGNYQNLLKWLKPSLPFILIRRLLPF